MRVDIGRICVKIAGKDAGKYCIIVKNVDNNFVIITGPKKLTGIKRKKCNINHLKLLQEKLEIKENCDDIEILNIWEKSGLMTKFGLESKK